LYFSATAAIPPSFFGGGAPPDLSLRPLPGRERPAEPGAVPGAAGVQDVGAVLAGQDVGDGRLADVAAGAGAVLGHDLFEGGQFQDPDGVEQFLPGELDVLAECLGDLDAGLGEFGFQQFLEHRHAGTATGSGAGAALQLAEFLDGCIPVAGAAAVDSVANGPGSHVVAGTQDGVVRQFRLRGLAAAGSAEERARLGGKFAAQERAKAHVR
jgi:hypothetical protein